jgi:hypothetical protein
MQNTKIRPEDKEDSVEKIKNNLIKHGMLTRVPPKTY